MLAALVVKPFKASHGALGRITAKAEIPPVNGSEIKVLPGMAQVVICALVADFLQCYATPLVKVDNIA
jgi:hypothetical protein